jgi:AbrB family looped-hinge helix DNA binding protein
MMVVAMTDVEMVSNRVRLRGKGQITIPQSVRSSIGVNEGDILTLLQIGEVILLAPKQPQIPRLIDKITEMMDKEGISLVDLLQGLKEKREAIWREHVGDD